MPFFKATDTIIDLSKQGFKPIHASASAPKYFAAIGRFIVAFSAHVDGRLNGCLKAQIATDEIEIPSILVGEMRAGDVMANLRRILAARDVDEPTRRDVEQLFSEIEPLRKARDVVAHRACMVKGERMAFHNALLARTDAAVAVDVFTLKELRDFSDYAKRLEYRLIRTFSGIQPKLPLPGHKALLAMFASQIFELGLRELMKTNILAADKLKKMQAVNAAAHQAVKAYADAASNLPGPSIHDLEKASAAATRILAAEFELLKAPEGTALLEIPARLRKPNRSARVGTHRSQKRILPGT